MPTLGCDVERIPVAAPLEADEIGLLVTAPNILALVVRCDRDRVRAGCLESRDRGVVRMPIADRATMAEECRCEREWHYAKELHLPRFRAHRCPAGAPVGTPFR